MPRGISASIRKSPRAPSGAAPWSRLRATYLRIARSTELAVEFTERYENAEPEPLEKKLANDLSLLGEAVTTRIELQDQLILSMLGTEYEISQTTTVN